MEMESSRRSPLDRPGLKKPRLSDDSRISAGPPPPRARANERERDERDDSSSIRVSSNSSSYQQQQQELVAQYKTALAELTFNSKPIITNLTIIAGENQHAAKGIAATICNNVLEVPSEQKLPSLYLLDSIVKNIGKDYIKYFAAKLPEVFCKAYKQVDSSIHPGMRHLFGTWKGVFPPAPLQIIDKELGFSTIVNGASGTNSSRSDSQTQRPAIHVNPKVLEARLQQTRAKEINSDDGMGMVTSVEDAERSDRIAITGSTRKWTDLSGKISNTIRPQRELSNDPIYERKGLRDIKDHQFSSIISRQPDPGVGRINERTKERDDLDKPYYGAGVTASETAVGRRNGFDNLSYANYRGSAFSQADRQLSAISLNDANRSVQPMSKNWKNIEEEEFMWDDVDSKLTDYGETNNSVKDGWNIDKADKRGSVQRGQGIPHESEQSEFLRNKLESYPRLKPAGGEDRVPIFKDTDDNHLQPHTQRIQRNADPRRRLETSADVLSARRLGNHASSVWPPHEQLPSVNRINLINSRFSGQPDGEAISLSSGSSTNLISTLPGPGLLSHSRPPSLGPPTNIVSESSGVFGQQRQQPLQPPSPSAHPPSYLPRQKFPNAIDDHFRPPFPQMGHKSVQLPGHLNRTPHATVTQESSHTSAQNPSQQSHTLHNLLQPSTQSSQPSSTMFTQLRHHPPFLHQSQPELPVQQDQTQFQTLSQRSGTPPVLPFSGDVSSINSVDISGQSSTSSLLAAIMKSGLLPNNQTSGLQNINIQPPLPSGPPPIQTLTPSVPVVTASSLSIQPSQGIVAPQTGAMLPPLPPGPPPSSSLVTTSSQNSNSVSAVPNPFSSLLSSLVAKGLISSPAMEMSTVSTSQIPRVPDLGIEFSSASSVQVSIATDYSIDPPASVKEPYVEPSAPSVVESLVPYAEELNDLIGIDFKPEIIREFHPVVISSLFDELKHQCDECGLRFKLREQLYCHSNVHTSEQSELNSADESSRKWYSNTSNWVAGNMVPPQGPVPTTYLEELPPTYENCESMVIADESQSICALCGEAFEDFYSHEMDEWMYKGTVYLNSSEQNCKMESINETKELVPIVHVKCISSAGDNKGSTESDKMDQADG